MASDVTVLELVGAPGSGKSRLLRATRRDATDLDIHELPVATYRWVRNNSALVGSLLRVLPEDLGRKVTNRLIARGAITAPARERFDRAHPGFLSDAMAALHGRGAKLPDAGLLQTWLEQLAARYQLALEGDTPRSVLALEEGFANRGVGLFGYGYTSEEEPAVRTYARSMPLPVVTALVDADTDTVIARLERRGWTKRSAALSPHDKRAFVEGSRQVSRLVADELEGRGSVVVRIRSEDGREPGGVLAEALRRALSR